jgi:hypothetical protein
MGKHRIRYTRGSGRTSVQAVHATEEVDRPVGPISNRRMPRGVGFQAEDRRESRMAAGDFGVVQDSRAVSADVSFDSNIAATERVRVLQQDGHQQARNRQVPGQHDTQRDQILSC